MGEKFLAFFCNWVVTAPICVISGTFAFMIGNAILAVNNSGYLPAHRSAAEGALGGLILSPLVTIFSIIDYYILRDTADDRAWHFGNGCSLQAANSLPAMDFLLVLG